MSRRPGATSAANLSRDEILVVQRFDFKHAMRIIRNGCQDGDYNISIADNVVEFKGSSGFVVELTASTTAVIDYESDQLVLQGIGIQGDASTKSAIRRIIITKVENLTHEQQLHKSLRRSQQHEDSNGWSLHESPVSHHQRIDSGGPVADNKSFRTSPRAVPVVSDVGFNPPPIPQISAIQNSTPSQPSSPMAAVGGGPGNLRRAGPGSVKATASNKPQQPSYQPPPSITNPVVSVGRSDHENSYQKQMTSNTQNINYSIPSESIPRDIPERDVSRPYSVQQSLPPPESNYQQPVSTSFNKSDKRRVVEAKPAPVSCMLPTSILPPPNMRPFSTIGPSVSPVRVVDLVQEPSSEKGKLLMLVSEDAGGNNLVALYNGHSEVELYVETWISPGMRPASTVQKSIHPQYKADIFCITVQPGETIEFCVGGTGEPQPGWKTQPLTEVSYNRRKKDRETRVFEDYQRLQEVASTDAPELKVLEAAVAKRVPFIDLWFLPQPSSLAKKFEPAPPAEIDAWGRPTVFLPPGQNGQLFISEPSCNDIDMGVMGSAWLPCCLAALAERNDLKLIQSIFERHKAEYSSMGAYRLILCRDAWWRDVVIDDYVPLVRYPKKSLTDAPAFCHNVLQPREMWAAMIEKAYARLCGSYSSISTGYFHEGISDLTGFPCEKIKWEERKADNTLHSLISSTMASNSDTMVLLHTPNADSEYGDKESTYEKNGLALGHAYMILDNINISGHRLFRIRNPWPGVGKWKGRWSDNSKLWESNPEIAAATNHSPTNSDGTIWIAWPEVLDWFTGGSICYLIPDAGEIRLALPFKPSSPGFAVEIVVQTPIRLYISLFQKDQRNREDPIPYGCMNVTHLQQSPSDGTQWQRMREDYEWGSKDLLSIFDLNPEDGSNVFAIHDYDGGEKGGKIVDDMVCDLLLLLFYKNANSTIRLAADSQLHNSTKQVVALHYTPLERDGPTPEGSVYIKVCDGLFTDCRFLFKKNNNNNNKNNRNPDLSLKA